jgi:hypothetical protein
MQETSMKQARRNIQADRSLQSNFTTEVDSDKECIGYTRILYFVYLTMLSPTQDKWGATE